MTDNMVCMFYINHPGGARSCSLCSESIRLWNRWIQHNIHISAAYLTWIQNTTADSLSRHFAQTHEWEMNNEVLNDIFRQWGRPMIDLFAPKQNSKCHLCCWTESRFNGWCIFAQLEQELLYAFLPIPMIPKTIHKIKIDKAMVIMITPHGPGRCASRT